MRPFFDQLEDNFVVIPTLVVSLGRCSECPKVHAFQVRISWLTFEIGIEIDL